MLTQRHLALAASLLALPLVAGAQTDTPVQRAQQEQSALPDLVPELADPMRESFKVHNRGNAKADPSKLALGCSHINIGRGASPETDCALRAGRSEYADQETSDVVLIDVPALGPGETVNLRVPYWRDLTLNEEPAYRFKATADIEQQIEESDEDNNVARSQMTQVSID